MIIVEKKKKIQKTGAERAETANKLTSTGTKMSERDQTLVHKRRTKRYVL